MDRLQDQRVWLAVGAMAALVIVAVSWFTLVGPELASARELRQQSVDSGQQNQLLEAKAATLKNKAAKLPQYTASLKAALAALPYDSGLPALTRQLNAQGKVHDVRVESVTVSAVSPVVAATPPAPSPGDAGTGAPASTPTAGGLFSMQVAVQTSGSLPDQVAFLEAVRTDGPRRTLVTATQVSPGAGSKSDSVDRAASFTTQLTAFAAPQDPEQIRQLDKLARGDLGR